MKIPFVILRRIEWRLGLRGRRVRVPAGMTRFEFESALAALPPDVDPDELREFVEGGDEPDTRTRVFRERLRRLLWGMAGQGQPVSGRWTRLLN